MADLSLNYKTLSFALNKNRTCSVRGLIEWVTSVVVWGLCFIDINQEDPEKVSLLILQIKTSL